MSADAPLRTALVGCGPMARWHVNAVGACEEFELVALCDMDEGRARGLAERAQVTAVYTDFGAMLAAQRPEVVIVVTPNDSHAALTIQAAEAGARGVMCEKPMAICMGEGRAMVHACRAHGTSLAVNHQRRMSPPILKMRELIQAGAIGDLELIRGSCAGDVLSDATHLVDTIRFLTGDSPVKWVFGQVHRIIGEEVVRDPARVQMASGGFRYGHPVETGALGMWESEDGCRAEVMVGDLRLMGRPYGDYEVFGTQGRLWRNGDAPEVPLSIQDSSGGWRPVDVEPVDGREQNALTSRSSYARFAQMIRTGCDHPLSGDSALRDLEITMALFESARLRRKITLPLDQDRFPLQILIDEGAA
jgi:UDP-N-acetyl-2-amino-2-deoxyglucuronate dehydrogenase